MKRQGKDVYHNTSPELAPLMLVDQEVKASPSWLTDILTKRKSSNSYSSHGGSHSVLVYDLCVSTTSSKFWWPLCTTF